MEVRLIDITSEPVKRIYRAYRICYSKDKYEDIEIPSINGHPDIEKMINFIKSLMDKGHTSPMEHVSFSFSIEGLSRAALAQLTRHRTFSFNVESMRYVDAKNFNFVVPELEYLEENNREEMQETFRNMFQALKESYSDLIELGIKKEDARAILPQATTCNLIVTCDLHNFRNFLRQRLCVHAQSEIRELADEMNKLVKVQVPFVDYKVLRCQQGLCNECKSR